MWADTLLRAEQQHLVRLLIWAGLSIVAATALATMLSARRVRSPLLRHFALQMVVWGVTIGAIAAVGLATAGLRDVAGAARLERLVWTNVGLAVGYVGIGAALALSAWFPARRMSLVGAGVGVMTQGLALLLIELQFAAIVSR
ncbi:MAG: DUF6992 family protein [Gemmatimonadaceae bacterium]